MSSPCLSGALLIPLGHCHVDSFKVMCLRTRGPTSPAASTDSQLKKGPGKEITLDPPSYKLMSNTRASQARWARLPSCPIDSGQIINPCCFTPQHLCLFLILQDVTDKLVCIVKCLLKYETRV